MGMNKQKLIEKGLKKRKSNQELEKLRHEFTDIVIAITESIKCLHLGASSYDADETITGISIQCNGNGDWKGVIKRRITNEETGTASTVAYTRQGSLVECLAAFDQCMERRLFTWYTDQYADNKRSTGSHIR